MYDPKRAPRRARQMGTLMARSNAAQLGTRIRRRNRKRSGGAVAVVRSVAAAIHALATWSSFNSLGRDYGPARFIPVS